MGYHTVDIPVSFVTIFVKYLHMELTGGKYNGLILIIIDVLFSSYSVGKDKT
jgi:hypothetical protein